jgi:hypothetical protein
MKTMEASTMNLKQIFLAGVFSMGLVTHSYAAVSAAEAQQLGTTLTAFGAEKAGSSDGVIPPYTGGIATMTGLPQANAEKGYPDPFASEQPVFSVAGSNMSQYSSELTAGEQALLQRYPSFRIDVYPTHRTMS